MKTSCINHPEKQSLILAREWQIKFCDGDLCAAVLMSYFEYWHNIKLAMQEKNHQANNIAEAHGDHRTQDESLLQFHSLTEIQTETLNAFSRTKIIQALSFLESKEVISKHRNPNPRYSFDKTTYYQFHPEICQYYLENNLKNNELVSDDDDETIEVQKQTIDSPNLDYRQSNFGRRQSNSELAITETSTEIPKHIHHQPTAARDLESIDQTTLLAAADFENENEIKAQDEVAKSNNEAESLFIGKTLTKSQKNAVSEFILFILSLTPSTCGKSPKQLFSEIEACLLDPKTFTQSQQLFLKKFNTLKKVMRAGRWQGQFECVTGQAHISDQPFSTSEMPVSHNAEQSLMIQSRIYSVKQEMAALRLEKKSHESALNRLDEQFHDHTDKSVKTSFEKSIHRCDETIKSLCAEVQSLEQQFTTISQIKQEKAI